MKTQILFFIIALFMLGCAAPEDNSTATSPTQQSDTKEDPLAISIKFAVSTATDLYFSDGESMELWKSGAIEKAGPLEFSIDDILLTLDASGDTIDSMTLEKIPYKIKRTDSGVFYCFQYSAAEAYAMGGLYQIYSEFYLDNAIISDWYLNQFECRDLVSVGFELFAIDQNGAYQVISGSSSEVSHVKDSEFYISSLNITAKTIDFNLSTENYGYNYILNAKSWTKYNDEYYSQNGYIWSLPDGLLEEATELKDFNIYPYPVIPALPYGESPSVIAAGISGNKLYFIEGNSGFVFEYQVDTDYLEQKYRIYTGDGTRAFGQIMKKSLKPLIVDGSLYFSESNSIYKLDLDTGIKIIFYAGPGEIIEYE